MITMPYDPPYSGNGVLYSAVLLMLYGEKEEKRVIEFIRSCVQDEILYRRPDRNDIPDSHDNYTGFAVVMPKEDCRKLYWAGFKRFFKMDGNHLIRFPQIWAMLFLSGYPNILTKILLFPFFLILSFTLNPYKKGVNDLENLLDTSGLQLQWVIANYIDRHYPFLKVYKRWKNNVHSKLGVNEYKIFSIYYGPDHPITKAFL